MSHESYASSGAPARSPPRSRTASPGSRLLQPSDSMYLMKGNCMSYITEIQLREKVLLVMHSQMSMALHGAYGLRGFAPNKLLILPTARNQNKCAFRLTLMEGL